MLQPHVHMYVCMYMHILKLTRVIVKILLFAFFLKIYLMYSIGFDQNDFDFN